VPLIQQEITVRLLIGPHDLADRSGCRRGSKVHAGGHLMPE